LEVGGFDGEVEEPKCDSEANKTSCILQFEVTSISQNFKGVNALIQKGKGYIGAKGRQ